MSDHKSQGRPLILYGPSPEDTAPLLPGNPQRARSTNGWKVVLSCLLALSFLQFVVVNLYTHFTSCPLYPETMNAIRRSWESEVAKHDIMREQWRLEEQEHDRTVEERKKREEEERQKLNLFWEDVQKSHTCITYGTREYTARLMNLPTTWEHRVEACKATAIEIHGVSYLPKSCEDKGPGVVIGRWAVNENEPDCAPFWIWYKDKGCTSSGSGKRRIEHYLENLPPGGDWREFCATTPVEFRGLAFGGAQECFLSNENGGIWGYWVIDDNSCL